MSCTNTSTVNLVPLSSPNVSFLVSACLGGFTVALQNAEIVINGLTGFTNNNGQVNFGISNPGTYTYTISKTTFATITGTITISSLCGEASFSTILRPGQGYACSFAYPPNPSHNIYNWPTVINGSDSVYGAFTMTYSGDPTEGQGIWTGSLNGTYPGFCGCISQGINIFYELLSGGTGISQLATVNQPPIGSNCNIIGGNGQFDISYSSYPLMYIIGLNPAPSAPTNCQEGFGANNLYPSGGTLTFTP